MESNVQIKCRKCRTIIMKISANNLLDAHSEKITNDPAQLQSNCLTIDHRTEFFFNEDGLESWIQEEIERSEWTKGKLKCHKCTANVGSFDFVSGSQQCSCKQFNQPPVHFIRSKIDLEYLK